MPTTRINDIDMRFDVSGTGPPLMLIAGTGYPGSTWPRRFVEPLTRRCTVIRFDHRGTGDTVGGSGPYSTREFADDARALLERLDAEPAHVLGHSMGGRVAQWMAIDASRSVRSLVLAASGPGQIRPDQPYSRGIPVRTAEQLIEQGYERYIANHIRDTFFTEDFARSHPEVIEELVSSFWSHRPSLRDYLEHITARQRHQTAERLAEISVPTLVLVGDHDTGVRGTGSHLDQSRFLADRIPGAQLHVLGDTSHGYIWQTPERTVDVVASWIDQIEAA